MFLQNITWLSLCPIICSRTLISPYCLLLSRALCTLISHCYKPREPHHPLLCLPISVAAFYSSGLVHFPQHKACTPILHHFFNLNCTPHSNQRNLITAKLQLCPLAYSSAFLLPFESCTDVLISAVSIPPPLSFRFISFLPIPPSYFPNCPKLWFSHFHLYNLLLLYCPHICSIFTLFLFCKDPFVPKTVWWVHLALGKHWLMLPILSQ